jgi:hypothetical protein
MCSGAFAAFLVALMLPLAEAANVQVFHIVSGNSGSESLTLKGGQFVSGSFTVTGSDYDQQIAFYVMNPQGDLVFDYGSVSGGAEFNFTADQYGVYALVFFSFPSLPASEKTVTLTYDVMTPEVSSPDYFYYSVLTAIVLALALTFVFILCDRRKSRRSVKEFKRAPMVRMISD